MLAAVSFIKWINDKFKNNIILISYITIIIILFIIFYPITSGMPVSKDYVEGLKWFSTWNF